MKKFIFLFVAMLGLCYGYSQSPEDLVEPNETTPEVLYLTVTGVDSLGTYEEMWSLDTKVYNNDSTFVAVYTNSQGESRSLQMKLVEPGIFESRVGTQFKIEQYRSFLGNGIRLWQIPDRTLCFTIYNPLLLFNIEKED